MLVAFHHGAHRSDTISWLCYHYCEGLRMMMTRFVEKKLRLDNQFSPLLLHDISRAHIAEQTIFTLLEFQIEAFRHSPYSHNLIRTDFHFFRNLDNNLQGKQFSFRVAVKNEF